MTSYIVQRGHQSQKKADDVIEVLRTPGQGTGNIPILVFTNDRLIKETIEIVEGDKWVGSTTDDKLVKGYIIGLTHLRDDMKCQWNVHNATVV
jgi:hypothetical protein